MKTKRSHVPIARVGNWWVARPRVGILVDGEIKTVQRAIRIALAEGRSKRPPQQVIQLAAEEVRRIKGSFNSPLVNREIGDFYRSIFLPHAEERLRPSTYVGYKGLWERYIQGRPFASFWIRDLKTHHVQTLLEDVARVNKVSKRTLQHLKHLLSGVFRYAAQQDYLDANHNPVTLASIPGFAPNGSETCAYSLEDVSRMLQLLPDPARTIVAVAAYSGMRAGEIRGSRWEAYQPATDEESLGLIQVRRSIWRKHSTDPKTEKSRASIPVIPQLALHLEAWRKNCGNPIAGPIFQNGAAEPLSLDSLYWRKMRGILKSANIPWHGWHGFRRGLASNLNRLGVDDSVIQAILRHSHISVTQACYIKTVRPEIEAAMRRFSESLIAKSTSVLENKDSRGTTTLQ